MGQVWAEVLVPALTRELERSEHSDPEGATLVRRRGREVGELGADAASLLDALLADLAPSGAAGAASAEAAAARRHALVKRVQRLEQARCAGGETMGSGWQRSQR